MAGWDHECSNLTQWVASSYGGRKDALGYLGSFQRVGSRCP
jgi:hypothetical protein